VELKSSIFNIDKYRYATQSITLGIEVLFFFLDFLSFKILDSTSFFQAGIKYKSLCFYVLSNSSLWIFIIKYL